MADADLVTREILQAFAERGADGAPRYDSEVVRRALPLLVLAGGDVPDALVATMQAFFAEAGITAGMSVDDAQRRIAAWRAAWPLPPELLARLEEIATGAGAAGLAGRAAALAKTVGTPIDHRPVSQRGPAGEGQLRGGLMARIQMTTTKKKAP